GCATRPSWRGAADVARTFSRIPGSKSPPASISASMPNSLSSTAFDPNRPHEPRAADWSCRRWRKAGPMVTWVEAIPYTAGLRRRWLRKWLARGEVVGIQAFLQLGIPFRNRLRAIVGIGRLHLLGASICRLPGAEHRLTL